MHLQSFDVFNSFDNLLELVLISSHWCYIIFLINKSKKKNDLVYLFTGFYLSFLVMRNQRRPYLHFLKFIGSVIIPVFKCIQRLSAVMIRRRKNALHGTTT